MRTSGIVIPEQAPSQEEPVPSYLVPQNGSAPKGNWSFEPELGEFVWIPVDNQGLPLNKYQPVLPTLPEREAPVIPKPAERFEDGSVYGTPRQ